jgi:hypothetical protein
VIAVAAGLAVAAAPPDFRRAWTCDSRSQIDDVSTTVIRTLDKAGVQLDVHVQWSIDPKRPFTASLFGMTSKVGAGDPLLRVEPVLASWVSPTADGVDSMAPLVVVHAEGEQPRRADGGKRIDRTDGSFSAEIPWSRVTALSRRSESARLSVVNRKGQVIGSTGVELRQVRRALAGVEEGLAETRWQMGDFEERCEQVTEWLTF